MNVVSARNRDTSPALWAAHYARAAIRHLRTLPQTDHVCTAPEAVKRDEAYRAARHDAKDAVRLAVRAYWHERDTTRTEAAWTLAWNAARDAQIAAHRAGVPKHL